MAKTFFTVARKVEKENSDVHFFANFTSIIMIQKIQQPNPNAKGKATIASFL